MKRSAYESLLRYWELEEALLGGQLEAVLEARGLKVESTCGGLRVQRGGKEFGLGPMATTRNEVVAVFLEPTMRLEWIQSFLANLSELVDWQSVCRGRKIHGALAYLDSEDEARRYAERVGLFLIRVIDGRASIENGPGFKPRSFDRGAAWPPR